MPGRRPAKEGSFGGHFDEVVKHFPHQPPPGPSDQPEEDSRTLQEKRDIHALLFERAWRLDSERADEKAS
ncbi:MAG: hypothetical protein ACJ8E6_02050 [Sphingomicrobium sp.]